MLCVTRVNGKIIYEGRIHISHSDRDDVPNARGRDTEACKPALPHQVDQFPHVPDRRLGPFHRHPSASTGQWADSQEESSVLGLVG